MLPMKAPRLVARTTRKPRAGGGFLYSAFAVTPSARLVEALQVRHYRLPSEVARCKALQRFAEFCNLACKILNRSLVRDPSGERLPFKIVVQKAGHPDSC